MANKKPVKLPWKQRLLMWLAVIGPGIVAAQADNDAGGISTLSVAGAHFGYQLLWVLFLITFSLAITQEMGARMGAVTGKGLAALIRERFGVKMTALAMLAMLIANMGTITAEFSGLAASFSIFDISKYLVVPIGALIVWLVLYKGSFRTAEKVFLIISAIYIVYVIAAFWTKPDWGNALTALVTPSLNGGFAYWLAFIALIGTTITPWGQFFIQSYVVDKGINTTNYAIEKIEVYFGAFLTDVISFFIIVTTANTLFTHGIHITDARDAALALEPLVGRFAEVLFAFGLFSASLLGAFILPTATAYACCEAFGWESGFNTTWKTGKVFYSIILICIVIPSLIVLLPGISLIKIMLWSQDINGILLPIILIYVLKIINTKEVMGKYANTRTVNIIAIATIVFIISASLALLFFTLWPSGLS